MIVYLAGYKSYAESWKLDTSDIYILSSYWEHKKGSFGDYVLQDKHILDSGAFSAFSGKNDGFDWDGYVKEYAEFIRKNNIRLFFELDIDVVVGLEKVEYYRKYIEDHVGRAPIPVWHASRKKDYFLRMCQDYPYVAIGTTTAMEEGRRIRNNPMVLKWFIDQAHAAGSKIHGLGFTSMTYLPYLNFDSVDSTTWLSGARFGRLMKFKDNTMINCKRPKGMRARNHDEINKHNFYEWVKFQKYAEEFL